MVIAWYFCEQKNRLKKDWKITFLYDNHNGYHLTILVLYLHLHRTLTPKYIRGISCYYDKCPLSKHIINYPSCKHPTNSIILRNIKQYSVVHTLLYPLCKAI